jgi:hypothetical protein
MDNSEVEGLPSRQETDQNVDEGDGVDRRADAIALAEAAVGAGAAVEAGGAGGGAAPVEPLTDSHESEVVTVTDRASAASELPDAVNSSAPIGVDAVENGGGGEEDRAVDECAILEALLPQGVRTARRQLRELHERLVQPESEFWSSEECTTVNRLVSKAIRDIEAAADAMANRKELVIGARHVSRSVCRAHRESYAAARALADLSGKNAKGAAASGSDGMLRLRDEIKGLATTTTAPALQTTNDDFAALYRDAHAIRSNFDECCRALYETLKEEDQFDVEWNLADLKSLWRCAEKNAFSNRGARDPAARKGAAGVLDVVRGSFICESVKAMENVTRALLKSSELLTIVRLKDRWNGSAPSPSGWADILVNVCLPGDETKHVCEVQVVHRGMLEALAGDETLTSSYEGYALTRAAVAMLARLRLTDSEAYRDDLERRYQEAKRDTAPQLTGSSDGSASKNYELLASLKDELDDHDELDEEINEILSQLAEEDAAEDFRACVPLDQQLRELREEQLILKEKRAEEDRRLAEAEEQARRDSEARAATKRLRDAGFEKGDPVYVHTSHVHAAGVVEAGARGFVEGPGRAQDIEGFAGLGGAVGAGIGGELVRVRFGTGELALVVLELPACAVQKTPLTALQMAQAAVDQAFRVAEQARQVAARVPRVAVHRTNRNDGTAANNSSSDEENGNDDSDNDDDYDQQQQQQQQQQQMRQRQRRGNAMNLRISASRVGSAHGGAFRGEIESVEKTILSTRAQDIPHGLGVFEFSDGSDYAGQFWHGQKTGHGVIRGPTQHQRTSSGESKYIVYAGEVSNGWKQGFGTWWNPDATVNYSGEWKAGMPFPQQKEQQQQQQQEGGALSTNQGQQGEGEETLHIFY